MGKKVEEWIKVRINEGRKGRKRIKEDIIEDGELEKGEEVVKKEELGRKKNRGRKCGIHESKKKIKERRGEIEGKRMESRKKNWRRKKNL